MRRRQVMIGLTATVGLGLLTWWTGPTVMAQRAPGFDKRRVVRITCKAGGRNLYLARRSYPGLIKGSTKVIDNGHTVEMTKNPKYDSHIWVIKPQGGTLVRIVAAESERHDLDAPKETVGR